MQRHYTIHGRVQGVFFRDSTRQKARELGLSGWARNLPQGTVEVVAVGAPEALESLEQWFRNGGPPAARVERVEVAEEPEEDLQDFRIR